MKGIASLLSRHARSPRESHSAERVASRLEPGQSIDLVDGSSLRVLGKTASANGMQFQVSSAAGREFLSLAQIAARGPMTQGMRRLAAFVHRIVAAGQSFDNYVKEAIRAAGYPVDPTMDWDKYLARMYRPMLNSITTDDELQDDAILEVIIHELFVKKVLQKNFNPQHEKLRGKEEASKVTAFLINVFSGRKQEVARYARKAMGVGARGQTGVAPTESLDQPFGSGSNESHPATRGDMLADERDDIGTMESDDEVQSFLDAFDEYLVAQKYQSYTLKALEYITEAFRRGDERSELRQHMVANPEFVSRFGKPLDTNAFNYVLGQWLQSVRAFAHDPESGWADTPLARMIASAARSIVEGGKPGKQKPVAAALNKAAMDPDEQLPQQPNLAENTAQAAPAPPPPPPNPNVQQQQALRQNLNTAQPEPEPVEENQQKYTIPPEIPGVNHTASEETPMPQTPKEAAVVPKKAAAKAKLAQRRMERKFARLRRVAEAEPAQVGEALTEITAGLHTIAGRVANLRSHLDLNDIAKDATIRQRVAHRNLFGQGLRHLAAQEPEELEVACNHLYGMLNELVTGFENLADNLGITLQEPAEDEGLLDEPLDTPEETAPAGGDPADPSFSEEMPEDHPAPAA